MRYIPASAMTLLVGAALLSAMSMPTAAYAQWENTYQVPVWNPGLDLLADSIRVPPNGENDVEEEEEVKTPLEKLRFQRSSRMARENMMNFGTSLRAKDQSTLDPLETIFVHSDLESIFVKVDLDVQAYKALDPLALRSDNLVDVYAFWWITMWEGAYGYSEVSSRPAMYGMVKRQVTDILLKMPQLQTATDDEKQAIADALLVKSLLLRDYMNRLEDAPAERATFGRAVESNAVRSGLNLSGLELTQNGFVPR